MKVKAELIIMKEEMTHKDLIDALNKNFKEIDETSYNRDQAILNSIGRVEKDVASLKTDVSRIIDHLSGKKLLTED